MEFRLNKIDTEIRQVINDATKEGKVHSYKKSNKINKDGKNNKEKGGTFKEQLKKESDKNKLFVDAVKRAEVNVDASKEDYIGELNQGRFLDIKR